MPRPAARFPSKSSSMIATGNACWNFMRLLPLELELRRELHALVARARAALLLVLAPQELAAGHDVLRRVIEQVHRAVLALVEGVEDLAVGVGLPMHAAAERARPFVVPVVVVVEKTAHGL